VLEKGNAKGYKDGVKATDSAYNHGKGFSNTKNLLIGAGLPPSYFFKGILDEVAIFNKALSQDDINNIMTNGLKLALNLGAAVSPSGKLATTWGRLKK
jgi:hypothetical protein